MKKDDILRMAREASEETHWKPALGNEHVVEFMTRFAALVAAAEREACARVVEDVEPSLSPIINMANRLAAAVIRARSNT
jgi:hypothetical protein